MNEREFWERVGRDPATAVENAYGVPPYDLRPVVDRVLNAMPSAGTIVDLGCGPGRLTRAVAKARPALNVVGVDWSESMLDRARGDAQQTNIEWLVSIADVPVLRADGAYSVTMLQHCDEAAVRHYLGELYRALRNGSPALLQFSVEGAGQPLSWAVSTTDFAAWCEEAGFAIESIEADRAFGAWRWATVIR